MASWICGLVFCFTLGFSSLFCSIYLQFAFIPLMFFSWSRPLFRKYNDFLMGSWFTAVASLLEDINGVKLVTTGDHLSHKDRYLMIMNHRTRLDWMFLWSWVLRFGRPSNEKIVLKAPLKSAPGAGWGMQLCMFLFLNRKWEADRSNMHSLLNYFTSTSYPLQLLLFPEGTDLTPNTLASSDRYAEKAGLPKLKYVLYPRTTGFVECLQLLHGHNYKLVDLTIAYHPFIPNNEKALFQGDFPHNVHVHQRVYDVDTVINSGDIGEWCRERWTEKEAILEEFYRDGYFKGQTTQLTHPERHYIVKYKWMSLFMWWVFMASVTYMLVASTWARWYMLLASVVYTVITFAGGIDHVEHRISNGIPLRLPMSSMSVNNNDKLS